MLRLKNIVKILVFISVFGTRLYSYAGPTEALSLAINDRMMRVEDFRYLRSIAHELGIRVWLADDSAVGFANYVKNDLLREAGIKKFQDHRFDYSGANIYMSTHALKLITDGSSEQASILREKASSFRLRSQPAVEVIISKDASISAEEIELDRQSEMDPIFLIAIANGELAYVRVPHPRIFDIIGYLQKLFEFNLKVPKVDWEHLKHDVDSLNLEAEITSENAARDLEKKAFDLMNRTMSRNYSYNTLEKLGLRNKLLETSRSKKLTTLTRAMSLIPIPMPSLALRARLGGTSAGEMAKENRIPHSVANHATNSGGAYRYELINANPDGTANIVFAGDARLGPGFYTCEGTTKTYPGLVTYFTVDDDARQGYDFNYIKLDGHNYNYISFQKNVLNAIPRFLPDMTPLEFFQNLESNSELFKKTFEGIDNLQRRIASHMVFLSQSDELKIIEVVKSIAKKGRSLVRWFELSISTKYPQILQDMMASESVYGRKAYIEMIEAGILFDPKWQKLGIAKTFIVALDIFQARNFAEHKAVRLFSTLEKSQRDAGVKALIAKEELEKDNSGNYKYEGFNGSHYSLDKYIVEDILPLVVDSPEIIKDYYLSHNSFIQEKVKEFVLAKMTFQARQKLLGEVSVDGQSCPGLFLTK